MIEWLIDIWEEYYTEGVLVMFSVWYLEIEFWNRVGLDEWC
jgi:hypothetical protein